MILHINNLKPCLISVFIFTFFSACSKNTMDIQWTVIGKEPSRGRVVLEFRSGDGASKHCTTRINKTKKN